MATDLFGEKPRRPRRWLMHVVDAGDSNCCDDGPAGQPVAVRYACTRCGLETDWQTAENISAAKRGVPCPNCNEEEPKP